MTRTSGRRLVAALACRNQGARLYAKPLQNLDIDGGIRVLDNIITCLRTVEPIDEIVLGISEGVENEMYKSVADQLGVRYVVGDRRDVLSRLIAAGRLGNATDIFRVTSESPFLYFEAVDELWMSHQKERADATFMDEIIDGCGFEIVSQSALETSHARGERKHRSELCTLYIREHPADFNVIKAKPPVDLIRKDLRLTIDYPEDLVVCRAAYAALRKDAPRIHVPDIVQFLDANPRLRELVAPFTEAGYTTMYR